LPLRWNPSKITKLIILLLFSDKLNKLTKFPKFIYFLITIYKFHIKLINMIYLKGTSIIHNNVVNNYLSKLVKSSKLLYNKKINYK